MADPKPGTYTWTSKDAKAIMASNGVQRSLRGHAQRGRDAFQRTANAHRRTGELATKVRIEPARGRDGRPGLRIVAYSKGNQSALFGTRRSRRVPAAEAAIAAIGSRQRGRR